MKVDWSKVDFRFNNASLVELTGQTVFTVSKARGTYGKDVPKNHGSDTPSGADAPTDLMAVASLLRQLHDQLSSKEGPHAHTVAALRAALAELQPTRTTLL